MRKEFKFTGKVIGQPRPRFTKAGAVYEPAHAKQYKQAIAAAYIEQCGGYNFGDLPLFVSITVARELPKSLQRKRQDVKLQDTAKPDIDNIAKAVLDALEGVAYDNDAQVIWLFAGKDARTSHDGAGDFLTVRIEDINHEA